MHCVVHDRERVGVSKNDNNEQHTEDQERTADSVATTVSPPRSQDGGHNGVKSTSLSSRSYLKSASISASKCVVVDGNKHPEVLMLNFPNSSNYKQARWACLLHTKLYSLCSKIIVILGFKIRSQIIVILVSQYPSLFPIHLYLDLSLPHFLRTPHFSLLNSRTQS
jgi:hypothetical protein